MITKELTGDFLYPLDFGIPSEESTPTPSSTESTVPKATQSRSKKHTSRKLFQISVYLWIIVLSMTFIYLGKAINLKSKYEILYDAKAHIQAFNYGGGEFYKDSYPYIQKLDRLATESEFFNEHRHDGVHEAILGVLGYTFSSVVLGVLLVLELAIPIILVRNKKAKFVF